MDLNYLILAHKNLTQLDLLVKTLTGTNTNIFIHLDKKIPHDKFQQFDFIKNHSVTILQKRLAINWGGFKTVQATLNLMKVASAKSKNGYFILISGQDFPIKSNQYIREVMEKNYGTQYIKHWPIPYEKWHSGGLDRIQYNWYIDSIGLTTSKILFHLQKGLQRKRSYPLTQLPYGGAQWWCLTYDCIQYILDLVENNAGVTALFEKTLLSDEIFFQTIVMNSSFKTQVVNDHLRHYTFKGGNSHPVILAINDLQNLKASPALWARKFDEHHDKQIISALVNLINS